MAGKRNPLMGKIVDSHSDVVSQALRRSEDSAVTRALDEIDTKQHMLSCEQVMRSAMGHATRVSQLNDELSQLVPSAKQSLDVLQAIHTAALVDTFIAHARRT